jgi:hypothetical protein
MPSHILLYNYMPLKPQMLYTFDVASLLKLKLTLSSSH